MHQPDKKGLRAGDRALYSFFETGPDALPSIFHLLKGLDHHLFLIRPDGHIAYHGLIKDVASLRSYLDGLFTQSTISLPVVERSRVF